MADGPVSRRLAAILAADVVAYSKLMAADEEGTLAAFSGHMTDHVRPSIADHHGRIVKTTGDGLLAEFASVVNATRCALAIQAGMVERSADMPADRRIVFRIGVNLGDVILQDGDVYGDGVNVAARLEGICEPGSVYISGTAFDHVTGKLDAAFESLGERELKNIARPVRVYRSLVDGASKPASPAMAVAGSSERELPSIAVLPFANMSGDPEQEYFADGLTEDLITALTRWRSFPVIARNSAFVYKGQDVDIKRVSAELGARYVLEGSVRKGGNRIRITGQLIDGSNGHHVWAERYDRDLDDIFEVQDEIVQHISAIVAPKLDKAELERSTSKKVEDLGAWDLCLRAKALLRQNTSANNASARELFRRAIASNEAYSDAYSGLAQSYNQDILLGVGQDRAAVATDAMDAARTAVQCDGVSSWAHHELSTAYQWLNRLDDALDEARTAVRLNPNDAYALHALGNKSDLAGDPAGIGYMERAQTLNPEDALRHTHLTFLARAYIAAGNPAAGLERARQALRRQPKSAPAHYIMALALAHLGRKQEAEAALAASEDLSAGFVLSRLEWRPYADAARNARLAEGLRLAKG